MDSWSNDNGQSYGNCKGSADDKGFWTGFADGFFGTAEKAAALAVSVVQVAGVCKTLPVAKGGRRS